MQKLIVVEGETRGHITMTGDWRAANKQGGRREVDEIMGLGEENMLKYTVQGCYNGI